MESTDVILLKKVLLNRNLSASSGRLSKGVVIRAKVKNDFAASARRKVLP
jgi:hypothetical protein